LKTPLLSPRISSVDAYRGFVMLLMMAEILRLGNVAEAVPDSNFWHFLGFHQSHVSWKGCSLHDLIQPSFSFLVGVALPFSISSRSSQLQSRSVMWIHTLRRSLILVLLGIFLRSMHSEQTNFTFEDTLTQIGLGYPFLFALGFSSHRTRYVSLALLLFCYWLIFALYPLPGPEFDWSEAGVASDWQHHFNGFAAHWNKNTNAAWAFDRWFLNLFPREAPFKFNGGGYSTLSFIPTLGTMILGLIAGHWIKSLKTGYVLLRQCFVAAALLFAAGVLLDMTGINPIVKRIWTPAWTLFSGGWCFLFLAAFHYLVDIRENASRFTFLIIIGSNSIAAYVMADTLAGFFDRSLHIHFGAYYNHILGISYQSIVSGTLILLIEFMILRSMYRKKIFIKI
jgi:predicted acyltransferase